MCFRIPDTRGRLRCELTLVKRGAVISDPEGTEHRLAIRTASAPQQVEEPDVRPVVEVVAEPDAPQRAVVEPGVPQVVAVAKPDAPRVVELEPGAPQTEAEPHVPPMVEVEAVLEQDAPQVVAAEPDAQRQEAVVAQPGAPRQGAEMAAELTSGAGRVGWPAAWAKFEGAVVGLQACR